MQKYCFTEPEVPKEKAPEPKPKKGELISQPKKIM